MTDQLTDQLFHDQIDSKDINWDGSLDDARQSIRVAVQKKKDEHEALVESVLNPKPKPPERKKISEEVLQLTSGGSVKRVVFSDGSENYESIAPRNRSQMSNAQQAEYGRKNGFGRTRKNPSIPALGELPE